MNSVAPACAAFVFPMEIAMNLPACLQRPIAACLVVLVAAIGLSACSPERAEDGAHASAKSATAAAEKPGKSNEDQRVLYYYDPMRPEVHFDQPGPSPFMDMQLVPRFAQGPAGSSVAVEAGLEQSLGVRTAKPRRASVRPEARVPARVMADANGQARLESRVAGWVERLRVRSPGQSVSAGQVFAEIYSPDLVRAQEEMLTGGEAGAAGSERLRRLGIAEGDIQAVRKAGHSLRRLPLRVPVSGVVTGLGVREGSSVDVGSMVAEIAASRSVWVEAQLFPAQRLKLGEPVSASFTLPGLPGRAWQGSAGRLVPISDPVTQTLALRFSIAGADDLPLGTVLDAHLSGAPRDAVLLVPADAVIRSARGDRVLVRHGAGFMPVAVSVGQRYGGELEILDGLGMADEIVVSGQFLLDAEASLSAGMARMGEADAVPAKGAEP